MAVVAAGTPRRLATEASSRCSSAEICPSAMAAMSAIWVMREASSAFMGRLLTPAPGGGERLREERRPVEHPGTAREGAVSEQAADRVRSSLREARRPERVHAERRLLPG